MARTCTHPKGCLEWLGPAIFLAWLDLIDQIAAEHIRRYCQGDSQ